MTRIQFPHKSPALTASFRVRQPPNAPFVPSCSPTAPRLPYGCLTRRYTGFPSVSSWPYPPPSKTTIPQLPPPASTAQTKSPANNTHHQTSKPKIKVNASADHPPPRYLSMKMFVIVSPPLQKKPTSSKKPNTPHANDNTSS